jgi:flagellar biosynthesis protein FliP
MQSVADQLLGGKDLTNSLKILLVMTLLAFLPAIVLTMTSFVRTVVVLSFVRQGVGTPATPPTQVIVGLSMFLTMFVMAPVFDRMNEIALKPYLEGQLTDIAAIQKATEPLKEFMLRQTRQSDLLLFYSATETALPEHPEDVSIRMAVPAFVLSELTTAFQMGVIVLLPFLVVDLAVASLLMSMGMMMVPPTTLSLPVKLLLFVLVDGWHLVAGSILRSYE